LLFFFGAGAGALCCRSAEYSEGLNVRVRAIEREASEVISASRDDGVCVVWFSRIMRHNGDVWRPLYGYGGVMRSVEGRIFCLPLVVSGPMTTEGVLAYSQVKSYGQSMGELRRRE
jgi:hypothetical protein